MDIEHILTDTMYYAVATAFTSDGETTFGAASSFKARVQPRDEEVASGGEQSVRYTAEIMTLTAIKRGDRLWLPGEDQTNDDLAHTPMSVQSAGQRGTTLYFIKM